MDKHKATLGIYGIQDSSDSDFPDLSHDHSLCYMQKGKLQHFIQLERLTRRKRDNQMYKHLYPLVKQLKITDPHLFDLVFVDNVLGRSFISNNGKIRFEAQPNHTLSYKVEKGKCWWFDKHIEAYAVSHELAHIFSCLPFCGSFKDNSLLVHFDGGASISNFSAWLWKDQNLQLIEYNWDLSHVSCFYNANALSFSILGSNPKEKNSVPGKLMGFASYGQYQQKIEDWLIENDFFKNIWSSKNTFFTKARKDFGYTKTSFDQHDSFIQDIAATMQHIFCRELLKKLMFLQKKTQARNLYYSGGSALNIVANRQILQMKLFDTVYIPPCPDDSGLALGAASYIEYKKHGKISMHKPFLNTVLLPSPHDTYTTDTIKGVAKLITEGKVVAVCNGYGEAGPRALGNRSIISKADSPELAKKISIEYKKREWYRPIAPVMLLKNLADFSDDIICAQLSRHMLTEYMINEKGCDELKGAVHVDGTSRVQTLEHREDNPFIYDLLLLLEKNYGIKALINTSFNYSGEPIVHTTKDAIHSANTMGINYLVVNGELVVL